MPSSSLVPHNNNSTSTETFVLQSSNGSKTRWVVAGRTLAKPYAVDVERKIAPNNSNANDHVILRCTHTEASTLAPYKLATMSATLDLSIPRDLTGFTSGNLTDASRMLAIISSLVDANSAMSVENASNTAICALVSGNDL